MAPKRSVGDAALADVAAELCALPLGAFTAERNARAKAARADGDRDLAARIAALAKPSLAAWVVDALVREAPDDLDRVLDLGADLREAQEDRDRDRLRDLTAKRRSLLPEVARAAAARAEEAGQRVSGSAIEEVQQTLQAALASPDAAAAVRTGRLVRSLDADGLDPVDLDDAVAGGASAARATPRRKGPAPADDRRREEEERRATERLDAAKRRAAETAAAARAAGADAEDRERDAEDLRRRLAELQERVDAAERAQHDAESAAEAARDDADAAATELERLVREA